MLKMLVTLALRHYRDPLSWAGVIAAVGTAAHLTIPPDYVGPLEAILGAAVSLLLLAADGRGNPNTDPATGAIPPRVQDGSSAAPAVGNPGSTPATNPMPASSGPAVRRIGPDHGDA